MCGVLRAQSSVGALQLIVGKIEVMKYDICYNAMLCHARRLQGGLYGVKGEGV